jgi:hypothetical protein
MNESLQCHHYFPYCVSRVYNTHLSAVDSDTRSSKVRESPEEKKLSASEHGRVDRVLLVSSAWSQLRGTWSLQNAASKVEFGASPADTKTLLPLVRAEYLVILSVPPTVSLLQ